ncbi:YqaJ viral recombinase family protein [Selenomonadales bacterium OttesenSCG-928-I06]|nr:YqaJ viral recombinase family protein [Selenomonadales bacterium OttesenSCG-928-I06]
MTMTLPNFEIVNDCIVLKDPLKKPKKITGTRLAAILELNPWSTPFEVWCDMTGFYKEPFEDNIYTKAGKIIEPKIIEYLDKRYFFGKNKIKTPDEWFGKTVQQLRYDHYHNEPILGGMWDCRIPNRIYELKTTKRAEDWYKNGVLNAPFYYKIQAALYAWLDKIDNFSLVLTILEDKDYAAPENFTPNTENTFVLSYSLEQEYPNFERHIEQVLNWHEKHIVTGISPKFDKKKDKKILDVIRTQKVEVSKEDPINSLLKAIEPLQAELDNQKEASKETEDKLKKLKEELKKELRSQMKSTDKKINVEGVLYEWEVRLENGGFDSKSFQVDHPELYQNYLKTTPTVKLVNKIKEAI